MSPYQSPHAERHKSHRAPWLRAAVLGANDGIVSTASLMLGVTAAALSDQAILTAGIASMVAGALSMAAGEYVSVSSQKDSEKADIAIERRSIAKNPAKEQAELAWIYEQRGLQPALAAEVARQLHAHDAVGAHARDELGINPGALANPLRAASASAATFSLGAIVPIIAAVLAPGSAVAWAITLASLVTLAISGAISAYVGGAHKVIAATRVLAGGGAAMAITYAIGHLLNLAGL